MKNDPSHRKKVSLFKVLYLFILAIWTMMALLSVSIVLYSREAVNQAVVKSQQSILAVATSQITTTLNSATNFLQEGVMDYVSNGTANTEKNTLADYLESARMASFLGIKMEVNPCVSCVFFTDAESSLRLVRYQSQVHYLEKFSISDYLGAAHTFTNDAETDCWHCIQVGDRYYLLQYYRLRYGGLGVLIELDNLLNGIEALNADNGTQYFLTDGEGIVVTGAAAGTTVHNDAAESLNRQELQVTAYMDGIPLRVSASSHVQGWLYDSSHVPLLFSAIGLLSLGLVAWQFFYLRQQFVAPVGNLLQATKAVIGGNLDYEAPDIANTEELSTLTTSFNYMTKEVKQQKIRAYEDEVQRQKIELNTLRLQLSPHFYLNAINTILSLSRQGHTQEIQDFIIALSQYLRYLFVDSTIPATVAGEISHTEDYIRLQQIRNPNTIFYMSEVEPAVQSLAMPRLMIQTFAENIFKHAFDGESMISIFIRARKIQQAGQNFCCITVEDSGDGFSEEFLHGNQVQTGTGLRTIRKTMQLAYGREDLLRLYNNDQGGACVELLIPMEKEIDGV